MPVMCMSREYSVLVFVPKVGFTYILLAINLILVAGGIVE